MDPLQPSPSLLTVPSSGSVRLKKMKSIQNSIRGLKFSYKEEVDPLIVASHEFYECSYRSFTWCSYCSDFIWGLSKQGWKCKLCGLDAHYRCVNLVGDVCPSKGQSKRSPSSASSLNEMASSEDEEAFYASSPTSLSAEGERMSLQEVAQALAKKGNSVKLNQSKNCLLVRLHMFQPFQFKAPTWCKHCNNFIFGFQKTAWKCVACGVEVHDQCVHSIRFLCHAKEVVDELDNLQLSQRRMQRRPTIRETERVRLAQMTDGYYLEDGYNDVNRPLDQETQGNYPFLENPEDSSAWYQLYFLNQPHDHFITSSKESDPFVMTIIRETKGSTDDSKAHQYRVIVWLKTGKEQTVIPVRSDQTLTAGQVLEIAFPPLASKKKSLRFLPRDSKVAAELAKELVVMEKEQCNFDFKFGVIYALPGQTHEDQLFSNREGSPQFYQFLDLLANRIELKGWNKFRGGLNFNEGQSYFTEFCGNNIMFHVSTLLPFNENDPQKLDRKRHIGNDIVCVVFYDHPIPLPPFSPSWISSHFIHTYAVVSPAGEEHPGKYRVCMINNKEVPPFGPDLPNPAIFDANQNFSNFFLSKLINAEKAAYMAPVFQKKRTSSLLSILQYIHTKFRNNAKRTSHKLDSPTTPTSPTGGSTFFDLRKSPSMDRKPQPISISAADRSSFSSFSSSSPSTSSFVGGDEPATPTTPWDELGEGSLASPTPWEEYAVIPVWEVVEEQDDGKSYHYDVKTQ